MPPLREVRNRIKGVKNISQITRALEAVSASRVRKAQARVLASRAYAEKAWEILLNIQAASQGAVPHVLLTERAEVKATMVVVITSDRGLAGSYNTNILRVVDRYASRSGVHVQYVAIGRKGRDSLIRIGANVVAEFSDLPPEPSIADLSPITRLALDAFLSGEVDEVLIAYTDFINILTQRPVILGWLPLTPHTTAEQVAGDHVKHVPEVTQGDLTYEYEPNASAVLDEIVPRFTELQLYQALLESQASEHAARMAAMSNATSNATQLVGDLTLEYNKARQAAITSEILDIVGGANALQQSIDALAANIAAGLELSEVLAAIQPHQENGEKPARKAQARATSTAPSEPVVAVVEAEAPETPAPEAPKRATRKKAVEGDDLTRIEGVGKKMAQALATAGLDTFAKVAKASEDDLRAAIEAAGMRFSPSLPTWAEQATYAAQGDWDGLDAFQKTLTAGRRDD